MFDLAITCFTQLQEFFLKARIFGFQKKPGCYTLHYRALLIIAPLRARTLTLGIRLPILVCPMILSFAHRLPVHQVASHRFQFRIYYLLLRVLHL